MDGKLERLALVLSEKQIEKLNKSKVLVVGIGGVGGYVCESLARSGIGELVIVDNDKVSISNINRQIIATKNTIGISKVIAMKNRIEEISDTKVTTIEAFYDSDSNFIDDSYDYIVDACDTISAKIELIKCAKKLNIKHITSMGMANRFDPSLIKRMDLSKTTNDPLAKVMRKLVKDHKIRGKIDVVCSLELPYKQNKLINPNGKTMKEKYPPASNAFVPCSAGLLIGSIVLKELIK